ALSAISRLTDEKTEALKQSQKLQQELVRFFCTSDLFRFDIRIETNGLGKRSTNVCASVKEEEEACYITIRSQDL
nr:hypothetical protein [Tanacetum cinerariifolium]GEZ84372.1 hypothetical protein [Tanacetum cinerariifolium]